MKFKLISIRTKQLFREYMLAETNVYIEKDLWVVSRSLLFESCPTDLSAVSVLITPLLDDVILTP